MLLMTSCCHCGRELYYYRSINQGCGNWCLQHKGFCSHRRHHIINEEGEAQKSEGLKNKLVHNLTKGAIIGAALGVTCVLSHVVCIITAFISHHYYLKTTASSVYSAMKNKNGQEEHPIKEAMISGAMETSNTAGVNALTSKMGKLFAKSIQKTPSVSVSWAEEIGKETGKSMIEEGTNAIFDWGSKAVV